MTLTPSDLPPLSGHDRAATSARRPSTSPAGASTASGRPGHDAAAFAVAVILPLFCSSLIVATLVAAPADERVTIVLGHHRGGRGRSLRRRLSASTAVCWCRACCCWAWTPGIAAVASLFLQVLVIPLGASAHYRVGNVSRIVAMPLILGGVTGAFIGPFFAAALPKDVIARVVAGLIVLVGVAVLATLHWGGLGSVRPLNETPRGRVGGIGLTAGFASGISGAGWGPIGVKLLILTAYRAAHRHRLVAVRAHLHGRGRGRRLCRQLDRVQGRQARLLAAGAALRGLRAPRCCRARSLSPSSAASGPPSASRSCPSASRCRR